MHKNQDDEQILVFRVGPVVCSVSSRLIESIVDYQALHHFPGQADFILGVLHYRNHAVPVVNLFKKFALPEPEHRSDGCFMMGSTIHGVAGFWVDQVLEVTTQYDLHKSHPPRFSNTDIFDCTLLWGEHIILQTDLNCLFAMSEPEPLQTWVSENQQYPIPSMNSPNSADDNAWRRSASDASVQEIDLLVSKGEEFSPKSEAVIVRPLPAELTSQPSESSPSTSTISEIDFEFGDQENAQLSLRFRSVSEVNDGYRTGDQIQLRFATQFLLKMEQEDISSVVIPSEIVGETVTLDVIAEQHGDMEQDFAIQSENAELPSLLNISQVPVGIEVSATTGISDTFVSKISNIDIAKSDTAFLHTDYVANDPDHSLPDNHEKIECQNTSFSLTEASSEPKLKTESFSNFSDSTSFNHLENECETLKFGADSLLDGTSEFDVLDDNSQIGDEKDQFKKDAAIEKVVGRITQKNERNKKTPQLRIVASIIISAFAVFLLQQYWLNTENEKTLVNVPSLQLLKERVDDQKLDALGSLQTVSDRYGEKYSLKTHRGIDL